VITYPALLLARVAEEGLILRSCTQAAARTPDSEPASPGSAAPRATHVRYRAANYGYSRSAQATHPAETQADLAGDPHLCTSRPCQPGIGVVVRGGVEPPTFRFSGLRITVQDWP